MAAVQTYLKEAFPPIEAITRIWESAWPSFSSLNSAIFYTHKERENATVGHMCATDGSVRPFDVSIVHMTSHGNIIQGESPSLMIIMTIISLSMM